MGDSIIKFSFRGEEVPSKCQHIQTGRREIMSLGVFPSHIIFFK